MVPNEAIGGIPPMHVPPYLDDGGAYEPEEIENNEENSVFNPFEFGRNGRLQYSWRPIVNRRIVRNSRCKVFVFMALGIELFPLFNASIYERVIVRHI